MKEIKRRNHTLIPETSDDVESAMIVNSQGCFVRHSDHAAIVAELEVKAKIYDMLRENYDLAGSLVEFVDMLDTKLKLAEAELARRNAAAGEPVGTVIGYAVNGVVVRGNGLKIGDSVFTAAPPATELQAENARLRQQRDAANAQIQTLNSIIAGDVE